MFDVLAALVDSTGAFPAVDADNNSAAVAADTDRPKNGTCVLLDDVMKVHFDELPCRTVSESELVFDHDY